jgi:hypothetical protein
VRCCYDPRLRLLSFKREGRCYAFVTYCEGCGRQESHVHWPGCKFWVQAMSRKSHAMRLAVEEAAELLI